jgi:hypothetical protein
VGEPGRSRRLRRAKATLQEDDSTVLCLAYGDDGIRIVLDSFGLELTQEGAPILQP